mgnify:CR=1 FL=1
MSFGGTISPASVQAAAQYPTIRRFSTHTACRVSPADHMLGFNGSNALAVKNTAWDIQAQKTGYIREAGRCLVMLANIATSASWSLAARTRAAGFTRLGDARRIKHWVRGRRALSAATRFRRSSHRHVSAARESRRPTSGQTRGARSGRCARV